MAVAGSRVDLDQRLAGGKGKTPLRKERICCLIHKMTVVFIIGICYDKGSQRLRRLPLLFSHK